MNIMEEKYIRTVEEFKKTKNYTLYCRILETAIYPNGYKMDGNWIGSFTISNEKYKCYVHYNPNTAAGIYIDSIIKRPDCNSSRKIKISQEVYNFLKDMYYSDKYAFGKWLISSELDWGKVDGV